MQSKTKALYAALVSAALLAACGGNPSNDRGNNPPVTDPVAKGIADSKSLFTEMKSDWQVMFGTGTTTTGAVETEANAFSEAMDAVQFPGDVLIKDSVALMTGIELFNDYKLGRTTVATRGRGDDGWYDASGFPPRFPVSAIGCTVSQDANGTAMATSPANANFVRCAARYFVVWGTSAPVQFVHGFTITPPASVAAGSSGTYAYTSQARQVQAGTPSVPVQTKSFSGTATATVNANGDATAFNVTGSVPAAYESGTTRLAAGIDHHDWTVTGSRSSSAAGTASLSGTIATKDAANTTTGTLSASATVTTVAARNGGTDLQAASMDFTWATGSAKFQGILAATDAERTRDGELVPTKYTLEGKATNNTTDFVTGKLTVTLGNLANYINSQLPNTSPSNFVNVDVAFNGTFTAPTRPVLDLAFTASGRADGTDNEGVQTAALTYRSLVNGTAKHTVNIAVNNSTEGAAVFTLTEPTKNLAMTINEGASSAEMRLADGTRIGTLNLDTAILTFVDNTTISVDIAK